MGTLLVLLGAAVRRPARPEARPGDHQSPPAYAIEHCRPPAVPIPRPEAPTPTEPADPYAQGNWRALLIPPCTIDHEGEICELPKLRSLRVDTGLDEAKGDDVIAFIRDFCGVNIIVDGAVRDVVDLERPCRFYASGLLLAEALDLLCSKYGLRWSVTEEHVVLLTSLSRPPVSE